MTVVLACVHMPRKWRTPCIGALFLAGVSCGGSTPAPSATPSPTAATLHAEVSDQVGDILSDARVPVSPDLVHATADVKAGNITWAVELALSTLDRQTTRVSIGLDTDQDASTGIPQWNGFGADYLIDLNPSAGQATVAKADPVGCAAHNSCFNAVGFASLVLGANSIQATVPLSLLGQDDGRMSFWLGSFASVSGLPSSTLDFLPDRPDEMPGRVQ